MPDVNSNEDIMDSRDVIEAVEELESDVEFKESEVEEAIGELDRLEEELEKIKEQIDDDDGSDDDVLLEVETARDEHETAIANQECIVDELREEVKDIEEELKPIKEFADEGEGYGDWEHGETLIRESYFVDYAKDLVQDIGDLPQVLPAYIENNIDWDGVANDLLIDYTSLDFEGETYYMRA